MSPIFSFDYSDIRAKLIPGEDHDTIEISIKKVEPINFVSFTVQVLGDEVKIVEVHK